MDYPSETGKRIRATFNLLLRLCDFELLGCDARFNASGLQRLRLCSVEKAVKLAREGEHVTWTRPGFDILHDLCRLSLYGFELSARLRGSVVLRQDFADVSPCRF